MKGARYFIQKAFDQRESWSGWVAFGLMLRLVVLVLVQGEPLVGDSLHYATVARQYLEGNFHDTYWPPGLPLYEAGWMWLFGSSDLSLRISMLPWFLALAWGVYGLIYRIHSRPAANVAVALLCIYPEMIHHSIEPLTHLPTAVCLVFLLAQVYKYMKGGWVSFLLTGFLLAFLVLLRPSSLVLAAAVPLWMLFQKRRFLKPAMVVLTCAMLVGAWISYLSETQGRTVWVNESNARNFYLGNNEWTPYYKTWYLGSHWEGEQNIDPAFGKTLARTDSLPEPARSKAYREAAMEHIRQQPLLFMGRTASRIRTILGFDTFTGARLARHHGMKTASYAVMGFDAILFPIILILGCGVLMGVWDKVLPKRERLLLFAGILLYSAPYFLAFSHPTYHLAFLPLLAAMAAIPISNRILPMGRNDVLSSKGNRKLIMITLIVLLIQLEWVLAMMP